MKKIISILIVLAILIFGAYQFGLLDNFISDNDDKIEKEKKDEVVEMVGDDKDEHGCIASAGYTWDDTKKNCVRVWEEEYADELCDEDGNRYKTAVDAQNAGLKDDSFGATYCPEYKMDPSWDINQDGKNDCYDDNSCSKDLDYMSPRVTVETEEKK